MSLSQAGPALVNTPHAFTVSGVALALTDATIHAEETLHEMASVSLCVPVVSNDTPYSFSPRKRHSPLESYKRQKTPLVTKREQNEGHGKEAHLPGHYLLLLKCL